MALLLQHSINSWTRSVFAATFKFIIFIYVVCVVQIATSRTMIVPLIRSLTCSFICSFALSSVRVHSRAFAVAEVQLTERELVDTQAEQHQRRGMRRRRGKRRPVSMLLHKLMIWTICLYAAINFNVSPRYGLPFSPSSFAGAPTPTHPILTISSLSLYLPFAMHRSISS